MTENLTIDSETLAKQQQDFLGSLAAKRLAVVGGLPELGGAGPPEDQQKPLDQIQSDIPRFRFNADLATAE